MSGSVYESQRHVYPRWRSFRATTSLGELDLPASERDFDPVPFDESLARGIADWQGDQSLWHSLDLLGTATIAGRVQEFAALVAKVRLDPGTPKGFMEFLSSLDDSERTLDSLCQCDGLSELDAGREVRNSRHRVALSPRDAVEWVELARAFTITGQNEKARRAIAAALQLAPENRFVLRSAARFFLHRGEKDRALSLLGTSPTVRVDPWVLASEIAIADSIGKSSKFVKIARRTMDAGIRPSDLTELGAALGTQEAENGNHRLARKLLRQSVTGANENSIAQIRWLNRNHLDDWVDTSDANPPLLHEANAWASFYKRDFETAKNEAVCWLLDQPFASAPAQLGSFVASDVLFDFRAGIQIASAGLRANPDDSCLLNNLAYSLLEVGRLEEAEAALIRARSGQERPQLYPALKATEGLLAFRRGDPSEGRILYLQAIEEARKLGQRALAAQAACHLVYEELLANTVDVQESSTRMKEFEDQKDVAELARFFERVLGLLKERQG